MEKQLKRIARALERIADALEVEETKHALGFHLPPVDNLKCEEDD